MDAPTFRASGVRTLVNGSVDLSSYSRIVFGLKYAPTPAGPGFGDTANCIADTTLTVSIGCNEYNTTFTKSVLMPPEWKTITMLFADFQEPSYLPATGTSFADCLRLVNGIDFQSQVDLLDGECAAGALGLDDITLRLPPATDGGVDGPSPDASTD